MPKQKNENTVISLQIEQLRDIDCQIENLTEEVKEIVESLYGRNDTLATAFGHTMNDAQQVLRLIIKTAKRSRFKTGSEQ